MIRILLVFSILVGMDRGSCLAQTDSSNDTVTIMNTIAIAKERSEGQDDTVIAILEKKLDQSIRINYENGIVQSAKHLANLYATHGLTERFEQTFSRALKICKQKRLERTLSQLYLGLGYLSKIKGTREEALEYFYLAINHAQRNSLELAKIYNNIVSLWPDYWSFEQASTYLDLAEKTARLYKDKKLLTYITHNRGHITIAKDIKKALIYYKESIQLARECGETSIEYLALSNIAGIYMKREQMGDALNYLLQAESLTGNIPPSYRCLVYNQLGNVYFVQKNYALSEQYLLKTLQFASSHKTSLYLMEAHEALATLYASKRDYKKAYFEQKIHTQLKDSLENKSLLRDLNVLETKFHSAQKNKELTEKKLKISQQENFLKQKNLWIGTVSSGAILLALALLSYYRINRHKRKAQSRQIQLLQEKQAVLQREQEILTQERQINQLKAMVKGEERERGRIGRELHDGIGGMLTAINMNLSSILQKHAGLADINELAKISGMLEETCSEVRKTAHNLMPDMLLQHNLKDALLLYFEQMNLQKSLNLDLQIYGQLDTLGKGIQLALYRIIQELVQNIIKHSGADYGAVQIILLEEKLSVLVEDNGTGINTQKESEGYGLKNLQFRVQAFQGKVSISSSPLQGTIVNIEFEMDKLMALQ